MASKTLRQAIFARFLASPALAALGLTNETIYPNFSPDGPTSERFLVMRWGVTTKGIGRVNHVSLGCWAYNRQPDYAPIADALAEIRAILLTFPGVVMSPTEAVLGVSYDGDSDDLYDDGYRAYTRWTSHTITASGS